MVRILLLDCSKSIAERMRTQGFNVEEGTVGFCTAIRRLPSQVYEKDVIIYNPSSISLVGGGIINSSHIHDLTPQYSLDYLESQIQNGATVIVFVNRISQTIEGQRTLYGWIPYMPLIDFTSDKVVGANSFADYPDSEWSLLAPIVTRENLELPVLQKIYSPERQRFANDVVALFWNGRGDHLGVLILRGRGRLIVLPRFESNDDAIETLLHRVVPNLYGQVARRTLIDLFVSPEEGAARAELKELHLQRAHLKDRENAARVRQATAARAKVNVINADVTAKQILIYFANARRHSDTALYYLYKIVEAIENKFGGEANGIRAVGTGVEWKSIKRLANESYRDARHAPKPSDVIKKWSDAEIKKCFEETEKVVMAYFATLFQAPAE